MLSIALWNRLLFAAANLALDDYATPTPFTSGKTQEPIQSETQRFHAANQKLLEVCDSLLEKNPRDVRALYFRGWAFENLAGEALAITKSTASAVSNGRRANNIHGRVLALDPDFVDAYFSRAGYEFAKATVPWSLKLLTLFLLRGDKEKAFGWLELVGEKGIYRRLDARLVLAVLNAWKGDPRIALRIFQELGGEFPENFLFDINLAAIHDLVLEDPKAALQVYRRLADNLDSKAPGIFLGEIQYRIGRTYWRLKDYSLALEALQRGLVAPKGEAETTGLIHFYIARIHEEQGDEVQARDHYRQVVETSAHLPTLASEVHTAGQRLRN
jgi:tetratricopeptide (TPR) repeat protein